METSSASETGSAPPPVVVDRTVEQRLASSETLAEIRTVTAAIYSPREGVIERCDDPELENYWWWTLWIRDSDDDGNLRARRLQWHRQMRERLGELSERICIGVLPEAK